MKIAEIKLANPIKMGQNELHYLNSITKKEITLSCNHDITLENGVMIKVVNRRTKDQVYTSLFNAIWWKNEEPKNEKEPAKKNDTESTAKGKPNSK